jgi:hypothetical protein
MSIIISKEGQKTQKLDKSDFEKEDYLQNYIHQNPESIPVYEIEKDKKLFVVKREFPTNSGPIDALAVDKDGDIYIVETKLFKNPDKRTVVAQALDYGSALWRHLNDFRELINMLDNECQENFNQTYKEKISEMFKLEDEQAENQLDAMKRNLSDGNLKFVILMDSMDERLKDLIIYVNQNSQFDIYAVQLEYYRFNDYEIMIPKLFGVEVKKNIKGSYSGTRKKWTKEDFLLDAQQKTNSKTLSIIKDILNFSYQHVNKEAYGTGNDGVFRFVLDTPKGVITPFLVKSNGLAIFNLDWSLEQGKISRGQAMQFVTELGEISGAEIEDGTNHEKSKITIDLSKINEIEKLKDAILKFVKSVNF